MITFRGMLDAMGIPYVDDGSPSLDYEVAIYDTTGDGDSTVEIVSMVNDHENKLVIISHMEITS